MTNQKKKKKKKEEAHEEVNGFCTSTFLKTPQNPLPLSVFTRKNVDWLVQPAHRWLESLSLVAVITPGPMRMAP